MFALEKTSSIASAYVVFAYPHSNPPKLMPSPSAAALDLACDDSAIRLAKRGEVRFQALVPSWCS